MKLAVRLGARITPQINVRASRSDACRGACATRLLDLLCRALIWRSQASLRDAKVSWDSCIRAPRRTATFRSSLRDFGGSNGIASCHWTNGICLRTRLPQASYDEMRLCTRAGQMGGRTDSGFQPKRCLVAEPQTRPWQGPIPQRAWSLASRQLAY